MASLQLTARGRFAPVAVWLLVVAVGSVMYWHLRNQPFFFDAGLYVKEAKSISAHGVLSNYPFSYERTYGYPFFLTAALGLAHLLHAGETTGIFLIQWPLFVASAWLASTSLVRAPATRLLAFAALAANPLLVVYAPQAFTESLTLSCVLLATGALGRAARLPLGPGAAAWLTGGAAASSYAVAVRPGNLLLPLCYALAAGAILFWHRDRRRVAMLVSSAAVVVAALVIPLVPQVVINHRYWHSVTPLAHLDLAGIQARWGLVLSRYATNVSTCRTAGLHFPNPHPFDVPAEVSTTGALRYYTTTWPDGPEQILLHLFTGFDPHPFLIDQRDFGAWYEPGLQALTLALIFLGAVGASRAVRRLRDTDGRVRIEALFLAAVGFIFLGVLATSAAEYRFGSIPLVVVSLLAATGAAGGIRVSRRSAVLLTVGYGFALLLWVTLSDLALSAEPIWRACS